MSARLLLQLLLLLQACAAGGLAWLMHARFGLSLWLAATCGIAIVLLVRLLITANNFVLTARFASATPADFHLALPARLRLFGEEFVATMLQTSWFMPKARPGQRIFTDSHVAPVLLLHGYGCNSGYWAQLIPLLDAARISHATLDLEPIMGDIDGYVPLVANAVDALCMRSGCDNVIIVAHSMGGLVARAYMRGHGSARVAKVITLGTPHHGTSLASFGVGHNALQMRRTGGVQESQGSPWLQELSASESPATRALVISLYTHHDNIIAPQTSSELPGATNIAFGGIGHVAMGRNPRVLSRVLQEIAANSHST